MAETITLSDQICQKTHIKQILKIIGPLVAKLEATTSIALTTIFGKCTGPQYRYY